MHVSRAFLASLFWEGLLAWASVALVLIGAFFREREIEVLPGESPELNRTNLG